jgi:hypothetical protein
MLSERKYNTSFMSERTPPRSRLYAWHGRLLLEWPSAKFQIAMAKMISIENPSLGKVVALLQQRGKEEGLTPKPHQLIRS